MELMMTYQHSILKNEKEILQYLFEEKLSLSEEIARKLFGEADGFNLSMAIRCQEKDFIRRCHARKLSEEKKALYDVGSYSGCGTYRIHEIVNVELAFEELEDAQFISRCDKTVELLSQGFYLIGYISEVQCGLLDSGHPIVSIQIQVQESEWRT